jgi:peroxiredoxin
MDAELVAISTDSIEDAKSMASVVNASFPILSDTTQTVAKSYGVFDILGDGVAAPATFIILNDGSVPMGHIAANIGDRPSPQDIINGLKSISE